MGFVNAPLLCKNSHLLSQTFAVTDGNNDIHALMGNYTNCDKMNNRLKAWQFQSTRSLMRPNWGTVKYARRKKPSCAF